MPAIERAQCPANDGGFEVKAANKGKSVTCVYS